MLDRKTKLQAIFCSLATLFMVGVYTLPIPSLANDNIVTCEPTPENTRPLSIQGNWSEGKVTIANTSNVCIFKMWAFSTQGTLGSQTYYDSKSIIVNPGQTVELLVNTPDCGQYYQLAVVKGEFDGFPTGQAVGTMPLLWSQSDVRACVTPSVSPSVAPSPSVSVSPTEIPTPTVAAIARRATTVSPTATPTPTNTQTPTSGSTSTQNPTATPTVTPTPTTSQSQTVSATATPTPTPRVLAANTVSATPTPVQTKGGKMVYEPANPKTTPTTGPGLISMLLFIPSAVGGLLLRKKA